jgi:hypothetical protein
MIVCEEEEVRSKEEESGSEVNNQGRRITDRRELRQGTYTQQLLESGKWGTS